MQEMKLHHIKELLNDGATKLQLPKTKSERKLFATDAFQKQLLKLFEIKDDSDLESNVIVKRGNFSKKNIRVRPLNATFLKLSLNSIFSFCFFLVFFFENTTFQYFTGI
ncbi:MAG: hypothetical protein WC141_04545 [Arcobacteraceae bacterium]